ncbi:hypothetical protein PENSTE_c006G04312 [Penicillium steckii]|uniref:DUF3074 domain-containing protein n=1 Tax=Penicillium steckii TaxID=303698 RepID=A0A1V6THG8_9EURO|nr:hypothetical protein PENSTE_c006G04312 [Penicillium steckii]
MAALHEALECLKPTSWEVVPQSPDELRDYVRDIFKNSRLVAESLPDPPTNENETSHTESARVISSSARVGETDPELTSLQKEWGKPLKMGGPKDNPLGVTVWKLSASDGGGSWFGRRSVHEGLPYTRWQEKLSAEYDETLKINRKKLEKGQVPDSCVRGIGAEEKVESIEVKDDDGSMLGQVMVYHVSAQFPKPTAPRDFVAMIITSETGLRAGGTKQPGRSWMMISKPCEHPGVPAKNGYVRGEYESVEIIREIPRKDSDEDTSGSENTKKGKGETTKDGGQEDGDETNPVEWIMVTRSDPGGSIPRYLVDKGTPKSVGTDAAKFVDWASKDDTSDRKSSDNSSQESQNSTKPEITCEADDDDDSDEFHSASDSDSDSTEIDAQSHHGLIASVTGLVNAGFERYAPQSVRDYLPHQSQVPESHRSSGVNTSRKSSNETPTSHPKQINSNSEITTTGDSESPTQNRDPDQASLSSAHSDTAIPGLEQNNLPPAELMKMTKTGKLSSHEKELAKLALRKREIDAKLDTIRAELDKLHLPSQSNPSTPLKGVFEESDASGMLKVPSEKRSSTPASSATQQSQQASGSEGQSSSQTKTQKSEPPTHMHKAASQLFHEEAKLLKQLRKIEGNQLKVASKIEARQKKDTDREEKSKSKTEVESLRGEVKSLKKELGNLRAERQKWIELVSSLQAENTKLAAEVNHE